MIYFSDIVIEIMIKKDPTLIKDINDKECYTCEEGSNFEVCRPFPSATSDLKCKEQCQYQYNASVYYYDKYGTKHCYCGNAKADCKQMANVKNCDEKSREACALKEGTVIGDKYVDKTGNQQKCQAECKKILKSDGLYCKEEMKCVCTDPKPLIESYKDPKSIKTETSQEGASCPATIDTLFCKDGTPIPTKAGGKLPASYFYKGTNHFLGPNDQTTNLKNMETAFCGCDKSVIVQYNEAFKDIKDPSKRPTLRNLWKCTIDELSGGNGKAEILPKNVYTLFNSKLLQVTGGNQQKINAMVAFEMCRNTNDVYSREKIQVSPKISDAGFGPWLKYHLDEQSKSGKILNKAVRFLVMGMLLHTLFRTVFPQSGNPRDSLAYAMFMPHQFLRGNDAGKGMVFAFSIVLILMIMSATYSFGVSKEVWEGTGAGLFVSLVVLAVGYYRRSGLLKGIGFIGIIASVLVLLVLSAEGSAKKPDDPQTGGGAFAKWYLPDFSSVKSTLTSGLALNIYFIIVAAFLTKIGIMGVTGTILGFVLVAIISVIIQLIYSSVFQENVKETFKSQFSVIYWIVLAVFAAIAVLSKFFAWGFNTEYLLPYVYATVIGVLPIAMFLIIVNIAITNYSPAIELLLLILYRMAGMFVARDPNSTFGKIILRMFGKRPTDDWVVPFLPLVSNFIELFYAITGDNKPGYFSPPNLATGVGNKNMFMS